MVLRPGVCILILIGMVLAGGCTQIPGNQAPTTQENKLVMDSATTSIPETPTRIPLPTASISLPADPIVGTWVCRAYLASGPLKKEYTFMEDGTWTRINTNLESLAQSTSKGTWRNESGDEYALLGSSGALATFQYERREDVLYDPHFDETFRRVPEKNLLTTGFPPLNLTVWSAQKVPKINGSRPTSGYVYILLNISVRNVDAPADFSCADKNFRVTYDDGPGSCSVNTKLEGRVENAFPLGGIAAGETRHGNIAVAVPENTHSFVVKIVNNEGDIVSNVVDVLNIQTNSL